MLGSVLIVSLIVLSQGNHTVAVMSTIFGASSAGTNYGAIDLL